MSLTPSLALMSFAVWASPLAAEERPQRLETQTLYQLVPDLELITKEGPVSLSALNAQRPVLLTFFFRRCTGSCNPFLRSLKSAVETVGGLGEHYQVVSVSFDPDDTLDDVEAQARDLKLSDNAAWHFAIARPHDLERLTQALRFWFERQGDSQQFDHPSVVFALRNNQVVRTLVGNVVDAGRVREAVWELKGKFVPFYATTDAPLFRCFQYNPKTGGFSPDWGLIFLVVPPLVALVLTALFFRRGRSQQRTRLTVAEPRVLRD